MATLKESGEAWIAAGQAEYGNMLANANDTIERLQKELDLSLRAEKSAVHTAAQVIQERDAALAEVERLKARIGAADHRLRDLKGLHTVWYHKPKYEIEPDEEAKLISEMEQIAFSTHCYLEGNPGPYLEKVGEK